MTVCFHPSPFLLFSSLTLLFDGPTHPPLHDPLHQAAVSQTWVHAVAFHSFIHSSVHLPLHLSTLIILAAVRFLCEHQVLHINFPFLLNELMLQDKFNKITNQVFITKMKPAVSAPMCKPLNHPSSDLGGLFYFLFLTLLRRKMKIRRVDLV